MYGRCRSSTVDPEVALELGDRAVDVDPGVRGVVGLPDRDRRAPEAVAADRPVAGVGQPLAELAVLHVVGHPGDVLVELDHPLPELGHLDEPAGHRPVDQRVLAPPAVRVGVVVGLPAEQHRAGGDRAGRGARGRRLEVVDDQQVGVEDVHALVVEHLGGEPAGRVDRHHGDDAGRVGGDLVLLAEGRRHVHDAGALVGGHVVRGQHPVGVGVAEEVAERRHVRPPHQLGAGEPLDHPVLGVLAELARIRRQPGLGQQVLARPSCSTTT